MKKIFLSAAFQFCVGIAFSQWLPDVRLTNDMGSSQTSYNNAWSIAANDNVVHIVWYDDRDGNQEIYYKRSTDNGITWEADTRLTNNIYVSLFPSVSVSGLVVHVVWRDDRDLNPEIYYKRSTDGGVSWGADTRLTNDSSNSYFPSISVSGSVVNVVWQDFRDGNFEIYYKRSTDGGISWEPDSRLTDNPNLSENPSVSVSDQVVHVVWDDDRDGNAEIYYKRSTDGGVSWEPDSRLTNNSGNSYYSSISVSAQLVNVVWYDFRDGNDEIYYKRSTDGGLSWEADTRLTNNTAFSWYPSVSISGSVAYVIWSDNRDGNFEIYYKRSIDAGATFGADTRLTNNSATSLLSSVTVSGPVVHVVWRDDRDGNYEIYYKRDSTGNSLGIEEFPSSVSQFHVYPNPAEQSAVISWMLEENENAELKIFDVTGKEIIKSEVRAQKSEIDVSNFENGIYFIQLKTGNRNVIQKFVKL